MLNWHFVAWQGQSQWIGMAKQSQFLTGHPITEPGEVWFEFGDTEKRALRNIKLSVLH